jgi:hypothetical protein
VSRAWREASGSTSPADELRRAASTRTSARGHRLDVLRLDVAEVYELRHVAASRTGREAIGST